MSARDLETVLSAINRNDVKWLEENVMHVMSNRRSEISRNLYDECYRDTALCEQVLVMVVGMVIASEGGYERAVRAIESRDGPHILDKALKLIDAWYVSINARALDNLSSQDYNVVQDALRTINRQMQLAADIINSAGRQSIRGGDSVFGSSSSGGLSREVRTSSAASGFSSHISNEDRPRSTAREVSIDDIFGDISRDAAPTKSSGNMFNTPEPEPEVATTKIAVVNDGTTIGLADIRERRANGTMPSYSMNNRPQAYNPKYYTRILTSSKSEWRETLIKGNSMEDYAKNRMYLDMHDVQFRKTAAIVEPEVVEEVMTKNDYGSDEFTIGEGAINHLNAIDVVTIGGEDSKPLFVKRKSNRIFRVTKEDEEFLNRILDNAKKGFFEATLAYFSGRDVNSLLPDHMIPYLNDSVMATLSMRINGSVAPLLEQYRNIEAVAKDFSDIRDDIHTDAPGFEDTILEHSVRTVRETFDVSKDNLLSLTMDETKAIENMTTEPDETIVVATSDYNDLYLPIPVTDLQMEVQAEWNEVHPTEFPKFHAMLTKLLNDNNQDGRVFNRVIFNDGQYLQVDRKWTGAKNPMVRIIKPEDVLIIREFLH